ncbi:ubiquitin carboxyl-terminal hydrolase 20-like isoform X5 [Panicum virgatum]|uniref:USP domain-containing protein n=1 Tax=Panicum virgatum TaxID=38727 RepID=A0A8T0NM66_PANVG|nr:ubiquitin carboxyl-terminal hydrolase 20-like isoform X5 [Panicum virgatum]KAG2550333.1 hypothetical protein PVAP13_9KG354765 [Panicum virgatum]
MSLIQYVTDGGEDALPTEIVKVIESIEVQLPSLAGDQNPCDMKQLEETVQPLGYLLVEEQQAMVVSDNNSKESEKQVPTQLCPSSQQQIPMLGCAGNEENQDVSPMRSSMVLIDNRPLSYDLSDIDNLSDDSPTRNSNDDSDHSDGFYHYDPICRYHDPYYPFMHRSQRRNFGYLCICNARRNRWHGDYSCTPDLINPCNPMASRDTEPWRRWTPPEPYHGKKRYDLASVHTGLASRWSSTEPYCGKKRYSVGAGLSNPHWWTCFLNCILQCMVHTVPLVLKLRKADHPDPCPRASVGFCCFCSLKLHAAESIRLSGSAFYPESFVNHLKSISSNFESGVQQDAQEFFCDLLEKLDKASLAPRSSLEEPSTTEEGGIAKEIFGGRLKSQLCCPECNRCSDKSEPFLDLSLEVNMVESLMDALQSFTKVELIEDFMCDGCKSRVNMEKHFKVEQAPGVLVIHLKRFTNSGGKILDKVKYPLELDINSFMSSLDDTPQKYDLYGVVVHHGIYGRGHYVCYIRSSVDDWYEFNDDKICRYSEASVLDSAAYLLFYVKQGSSPWFSTLLEKEDKFLQDGSVSLADQGTSVMCSPGQDNSGYCLAGPAEQNGNGPGLLDFSQDIQCNGSGDALSDASDKLAEGCCLGGMSAGTQELSCLTGSGDKNGRAGGFLEPWEKEDVSPMGSLDSDEMNPSTHGSSEVDPAVTQEGSPLKRENICSLLQLSHKCDDNCHCMNFSSHEDDETGGCSGAPSMGMGTSETETVESKSNHEFGDSEVGANKGCWEEDSAGCVSEKRKRPSSADTDGGGGRESKKPLAAANGTRAP